MTGDETAFYVLGQAWVPQPQGLKTRSVPVFKVD